MKRRSKLKRQNMKTRILLATIGTAALAAITFNVNAATALLSPRAAGNQIQAAPGVTAAQPAPVAQSVSPRTLGNPDYCRGQRGERRESRYGMPQDDRQSQGHSSLCRESRGHVGLLQNPMTDTTRNNRRCSVEPVARQNRRTAPTLQPSHQPGCPGDEKPVNYGRRTNPAAPETDEQRKYQSEPTQRLGALLRASRISPGCRRVSRKVSGGASKKPQPRPNPTATLPGWMRSRRWCCVRDWHWPPPPC